MSERWRSGLALLLSLVIFGVILVVGPGAEMDGLRRVLGLSERIGSPADVPPGGTYAFLQHQPGRSGEPVAWDPCRPIRYEVNPDGGPDDAEDLARDAVAEVAAVTGLGFEYEGTTDRRPSWTGGERTVLVRFEPVLIAWATADEVAELAGRSPASAAPARSRSNPAGGATSPAASPWTRTRTTASTRTRSGRSSSTSSATSWASTTSTRRPS
ncbi:hypothetical protein [Nocardioides sp. TF02-7]|uniref:hypothetical protein n=1 Tax=Nocardioides sp. TF02-7 TaxID=2917724 RepID=UPI001F059C4F|nr:hypothetical protein [Nocardioides sp. TF02-7]UMG94979.1 hypothetical protein MF408_15480 [Nocardioides sp. TF02-7]